MARVLLDHCVDRRLARALAGHTVRTAFQELWSHLPDKLLLERAQATFDVLDTTDQAMPSQQRVSDFQLMLVVLRGKTDRLADLLPLVPSLSEALSAILPGTTVVIGGGSSAER